jgi:hypothetical protein
MRFCKVFLYAGLASAFLFAVSAPAKAGTVVVMDSGGGTVDVHGTAAGADINDFNTMITEINGVAVNIPVTLNTLHITDAGGVITGTGVETIGTGAQTAVLDFSITSGVVFGSHFNMDGVITKVVSNKLPGYDFSLFKLSGAMITLAIDKTGTNYANIVNHAGKVANRSGFGLQESAVPEPASMSLLGIGMAGFFACRRFFKRSVAG